MHVCRRPSMARGPAKPDAKRLVSSLMRSSSVDYKEACVVHGLMRWLRQMCGLGSGSGRETLKRVDCMMRRGWEAGIGWRTF